MDQSLKTIKSKQNKWWMKTHFIFSLLIASQFYLIHHQFKHIDNNSLNSCVLCITSVNYIDAEENGIIHVEHDFVSTYKLNIGSSFPKKVPEYYFSRAPPTTI